MFIFTWGDRLVVLLATAVFVALGGGVGWLIAERIGAIIGVVALFPVTQFILAKILPKRYAQRSAPRA